MQFPASIPIKPLAVLRSYAWLAVPVAIFVFVLAIYTWINQSTFAHNNYFVPLADAFLHGRLDLAEHPTWLNELVPYGGKFYVVYPPMPAVLLMPFVWRWGAGMNQANVSVLLGALNVFLLYFILMYQGFGLGKRIFFSLFFAFGTIQWYSAQVGSSWHFAQICALTFLFAALVELYQDRRAWLMGLLLGCAALSRLTTLMAFPFFVAFLMHEAGMRRQLTLEVDGWRAWLRGLDRGYLLRQLVWFGGALVVPLGAYLAYNWARYGSPTTTGYNLIPGLLNEYQYRFGFFSIHSIPHNLYAMLMQMPHFVDDAPYLQSGRLGGLSLLLTTPLFLWAVKARGRNWFDLGAWCAILLTAVPILLHADPGGEQFGYRYALDFYPFLYLLALKGMGDKLTTEQKVAIALSLLVNAWGMWSKMHNFWA